MLVSCLSAAVAALFWLWGGLLPRPWPAGRERVSVTVTKVDVLLLWRRTVAAKGERVSVAVSNVDVWELRRWSGLTVRERV